jgi:hypothetical protein
MLCVGLKVLVLYSQRFGSEVGSKACRVLRKNLGSEFVVNQSVWNAELLKSPKLRMLAAKEAQEADIVFISTTEGRDLEPEVTEWLDLWRKRRRAGGAALVALLRRDSIHSPHIVAETLHQFAREAGMDFFCHSEVPKQICEEELQIAAELG